MASVGARAYMSLGVEITAGVQGAEPRVVGQGKDH